MVTDELFRSLTADTKPVELERRLLSHVSKRGSGGFDETFDRDGAFFLCSSSLSVSRARCYPSVSDF